VTEVCSQHLLSKPVPPAQRGRPVPADLEALILRCLEKQPDLRPPDARSLRVALEACADAGRWTQDDARAAWKPMPVAEPEPPAAPGAPARLEVTLTER
jgi:serine/threonine-protein kinase